MRAIERLKVSRKLFRHLAECDLKIAAFNLVKGLSGGIYKGEISAALDLFAKLPCPETALNLVLVLPETLGTMTSASDAFVRSIPKEGRGPRYNSLDEWIASMDANLDAVAAIQSFLLREVSAGRARVGFKKFGDQAAVFGRLDQVGVRKRPFSNRRQFLHDTITKNPSSYRSVIDMVCVGGFHERQERFWNGLGGETDIQFHTDSEIKFDIIEGTEAFVALLRDRTASNSFRSGELVVNTVAVLSGDPEFEEYCASFGDPPPQTRREELKARLRSKGYSDEVIAEAVSEYYKDIY